MILSVSVLSFWLKKGDIKSIFRNIREMFMRKGSIQFSFIGNCREIFLKIFEVVIGLNVAVPSKD